MTSIKNPTPIRYATQSISEKDILAVEKVLVSDWLTQGPTVELFEKSVAEYVKAQYAVATNSATSALHLACIALGLQKGDSLWTTVNTFVASANCALHCDAQVDFIDIDPKSYNMCPEALAKKLSKAQRIGKLPKIIVPVHFAGQPCDMKTIHELAKKYGCFIIEDAAHAIGSQYFDSQIGSCAFSDITVFSFHPAKIITTGEGGMLTTNSSEIYQKLLLLRNHGITRDPSLMLQPHQGDWYYEQQSLGFNYRMTDIQAALGISQLQRIDEFITRRIKLAKRYNEYLAGLPVVRPWQQAHGKSVWHLYVIQLMNSKLRTQVFDNLKSVGINVNVHYIPIHLHPYYKNLGFKEGDFPIAEKYYRKAISLPIHFNLQESEQEFVIEQLKSVLVNLVDVRQEEVL